MQLQYDEDLIEAVVFLFATRQGLVHPHPLQIQRFQRERDRLYSILDPDQRNQAFYRLHLEWFREWEIEAQLIAATDALPLLRAHLVHLAFRQARRHTDEGAELYVNTSGACSGVVALRPARFRNPLELAVFLRRELLHLSDMVDPAFGYQPEIPQGGLTLPQQNLIRQRYRLLWDISVDARIRLQGQVTTKGMAQHETEFNQAYGFWPETERRAVFESLWKDPHPTHLRLMALAADPRRVHNSQQPLPGAPCPLCGFPTFAWAVPLEEHAELLARIREEFPGWTPEQGACRRCVETYQAAIQNAPPHSAP